MPISPNPMATRITRTATMVSVASRVIASGLVTLALACEGPATGSLAPLDFDPAIAKEALATIDLSAISDIRNRVVLGVDDDQRGVLVAAVEAVANAVASGRAEELAHALRNLRVQASVKPGAIPSVCASASVSPSALESTSSILTRQNCLSGGGGWPSIWERGKL